MLTRKKIKQRKKARGFTKTYSTVKSSRVKQKYLEEEFKKIVLNLTSPEKEKLITPLTKLQAKTRGNKIRNNFSNIKIKLLKDKEKLFKESIGPKFYKTLQEIPIPLLDKILNNIFKNSTLSQDSYVIKIFLIARIKTSKIIQELNVILDNINEIQIKIFKYLNKYIECLDYIIINRNRHGSSDDEDEIESIHRDYLNNVESYRPKMIAIATILHSIFTFKNKIIQNLINIFNLVDDFTSKDNNEILQEKKIIEEFLKNLNRNWYLELNKCHEEESTNTHNSVLYTEIKSNLQDFKNSLPNTIEKVKSSFDTLFINKFVLVLNNDKIISEFERNKGEIFTQYEQYKQYLSFIKEKKKKTSKKTSHR